MSEALKPCPRCNGAMSRFFVSDKYIEVIACHYCAKVDNRPVHVRSIEARKFGWESTVDFWNDLIDRGGPFVFRHHPAHMDVSGPWLPYPKDSTPVYRKDTGS